MSQETSTTIHSKTSARIDESINTTNPVLFTELIVHSASPAESNELNQQQTTCIEVTYQTTDIASHKTVQRNHHGDASLNHRRSRQRLLCKKKDCTIDDADDTLPLYAIQVGLLTKEDKNHIRDYHPKC